MTNLSVDAAGLRSGRAASVIRPRDAGFNPQRPIHRDKSTCPRQIATNRTILLSSVEPFVSTIDITMGDEVPVYSRAKLSRTAATVVALLLTATAAGVAREFRAADAQSEADAGAIDLKCTKVAGPGTFVPAMNVPAVPFPSRVGPARSIAGIPTRVQQSEAMSDMIQPCGAGAAMAGSYAEARHDSAAPQPLERFREVE
jgi:hypothetical protein